MKTVVLKTFATNITMQTISTATQRQSTACCGDEDVYCESSWKL